MVADRFSESTVMKIPVRSAWSVLPTRTAEGRDGVGYVTSQGEEFEVVDSQGRVAFTFEPPSGEKVYLSRRGADRYHLMTAKHLYTLDPGGRQVGCFEFPHENNQRKMGLTADGRVVVSGMGKTKIFDRDGTEQATRDFGAQYIYSAGDTLILEKARKLFRLSGDEPVALSQDRVLGRNVSEAPDGRLWFLEAPESGPRQAACYDPKTGDCRRFPTTPGAGALVPLASGQVLTVEEGQVRCYSSEGDLQTVHNLGPGKLGDFQLDPTGNKVLAVMREEPKERLLSLDLEGGFWGRLSATVGLGRQAETVFESEGSIFACSTQQGDLVIFHKDGVRWGDRDFASVAEFAHQDLPKAASHTAYLGVGMGSGSDTEPNLRRTLASACRQFGWADPTATRLGDEPFSLSYVDDTVVVGTQESQVTETREQDAAEHLFIKKDDSYQLDGNRLEVPETGAKFYCNYLNGTRFTTAHPVRVGAGHFLAAASSDGQLHWLDAKKGTHLRFNLDQPIEDFWTGPDNYVRGLTASGTVFALKLELPPGQSLQATEPPIDIEFDEDEILIGSVPLQLD